MEAGETQGGNCCKALSASAARVHERGGGGFVQRAGRSTGENQRTRIPTKEGSDTGMTLSGTGGVLRENGIGSWEKK